MYNETNNINYLLQKIEQYFDCTLSDSEEAELRHELRLTHVKHPSVDEAKAIMAFRIIPYSLHDGVNNKSENVISKRKNIKYIAGIAAAVLISIILSFYIFIENINQNKSTCIAYVNGKRITDETMVMNLISNNLEEFEKVACNVNTEFIEEINVLGPIIDQNMSDNHFVNTH